MARKVELVRVENEGRDQGKVFRIDEWPAARADRWATKLLLTLNRGGGPIPTEALLGHGMEAIFLVGVQTFLRGNIVSEELIPLLDELLDCVMFVRDPKAISPETGMPIATPIVSDDDIEEVKTRWWLRGEVLRVHTNFSMNDVLSKLISALMTPKAPEFPTDDSKTS